MDVSKGYASIKERIDEATRRSGRAPETVVLVCVTKTWPADVVLDAYRAGIRHFGENRAEELAQKRREVESQLGRDSGIVWHLIGALQSRKTQLAADHADVFHALDRIKIARRVSNRLVQTGRDKLSPLPVFLEINVSGEASKSGFDCRNWEQDAAQREQLRAAAKLILGLPGLRIRGLMTMAPWQVEMTVVRDVFRRTWELSRWLESRLPTADWSNLSMGMTDDFEVAIEEGATHVRIGRAILGERQLS